MIDPSIHQGSLLSRLSFTTYSAISTLEFLLADTRWRPIPHSTAAGPFLADSWRIL